jgi:hypothetical protein
VEDNSNTSGGTDSVLHYTFTGSGTLTANFDASKSYIGSSSNNALHFTFGNNLGPDGNIYIADLGGGGNGSFNVSSGYIDGVYEFNPTTQSVSRFIQGSTEPSGPAGASGLSAPKYLQFDTNFVAAPDAGVPEPGTIGMLLAGLASLAVVRRRA